MDQDRISVVQITSRGAFALAPDPVLWIRGKDGRMGRPRQHPLRGEILVRLFAGFVIMCLFCPLAFLSS